MGVYVFCAEVHVEDVQECNLGTDEAVDDLATFGDFTDRDDDDFDDDDDGSDVNNDNVFPPFSQWSDGEDANNDGDAGDLDNSTEPRKARSYDRTMVCFYCDKVIKLNMPRHLKRVHSDEADVARLLACSSAEEKKLGFARLTNRGNFKHNCNVIESGQGDLIVGRQSTKPMTLSQKIQSYLPCIYCCVLYMKHDLWRHAQKCRFRCPDDMTCNSILIHSRMMLRGAVDIKLDVNDKFKADVLQGMRNDCITKIVLGDAIILKYGQHLHQRLGRNRAHDISQRMRQLARLIKEMNSGRPDEDPEVSLSECLSGSMFDNVVEATSFLSVPSTSTLGRPMFSNPSIGLKLGHALVKCAEIKKGLGIRQDDNGTIKEADAFLSQHKSEWTSSVSAHSLATFKHRKYNNPIQLPSVADLLKLKSYQESRMRKLADKLALQPSYSSWRELCEVVFTRVVIFNRRRSGEMAKLALPAYQNRPRWEEVASDEIKASLTALEKQLLKRYVPVFLSLLHVYFDCFLRARAHALKSLLEK